MDDYSKAKFDLGTATAKQDWAGVEQAAIQMLETRPNDECLDYLRQQIAAARSQLKKTRWQEYWSKPGQPGIFGKAARWTFGQRSQPKGAEEGV